MTYEAVVRLALKLYAAAGAREATDVDFETYCEALEDVTDERGLQAGRSLIRNVDLVAHRPSPGRVREAAVEIANREYTQRGGYVDANQNALPESAGSVEEAREWLAHFRGKRRAGEPRHIGGSLP